MHGDGAERDKRGLIGAYSLRHFRQEIARHRHPLGVVRRLIAGAGDEIADRDIGDFGRNGEHATAEPVAEMSATRLLGAGAIARPVDTGAAQFRFRRT